MVTQEYIEKLKEEPEIKWFTLSKEEVEEKLTTSSINGLSSAEVKTRYEKYGPNELTAEKKRPRWKVFLDQFKDVLIYILIIAVILSTIINFIKYQHLGEDGIVIAVIVILNAIIGYIQEGKADEAIEALKNFAAPESQVIRDGNEITVKARELVPGDLIVIHEGDMFPADGRIIEQSNLKVEEAALTGESVPVNKHEKIIEYEECPLAERKNMVFSSTLATYGRGKAIITETGMKTEVGKIATMISQAEEKMTPLQKNLDDFGKWLGKIILIICLAVILVYIIRFLLGTSNFGIFDSILAGVALAVAAIPEGLPAVVSVCLAIGVTRMSERNAIIKKLHSVETLGCTSVICSDKTGTLTKNEMTVRSAWAGGKIYDFTGSGYAPEGKILLDGNEVDVASNPDLDLTLKIGLLCNNARLNQDEKTKKWNTFGDPTEGCLITSAWKGGIDHETFKNKYSRLDEIPFDSSRKRMTTIHKVEGRKLAYIKGATELLLDLCKNIQIDGQIRLIEEDDKKQILESYEQKADEALRGLGFAYRDAEEIKVEVEEMEKDLTFVGMQFMIDPPRDEVKVAIQECKQAGIGVKMITGDNLITATAIARELGIVTPDEITHQGKDIPNMSDDEISDCHVFARVSPEHKQDIVKALQNKGFVVAMTGDGVNDAPALKNADVGVAMGITGTDVSKEAAVMVLADDNFATIVLAVEEGRGIYDNIKKFIQYLLSSNVMEVLVLFVASFFLPPPIVATQLLWINLVTDGAPAVALGFDPYDPTLMKQKPRPIDEPLLTKNFIITMLYRGIILAILILGIFILYDKVPGFMPTEVPEAHRLLVYDFEDLLDKDGIITTLLIEKYDSTSGLYQQLIDNGISAADMEEALLLDRYILWKARSVTFLVMMITEMTNAFNCRSEYNSIFKIGFFNNKIMLYSVGFSVISTVLLYFWQGLGNIFKVIPLNPIDWLWVIPSIIITIGCVELLKFYFRKKLNL